MELVERCRKGDEQAWSQLVDATYRDVFALCSRVLRDPADAADATQDAYLKAWRGLRSFRGDSMFTTWLYRVAMNAAISKHRARARRRRIEAPADDVVLTRAAGTGSTEAQAGARIDLATLERAVAALPDHYRLPVLLRDVYGRSISEIAAELRISETATKVRLHRARRKLRDALYPEDGRDEE